MIFGWTQIVGFQRNAKKKTHLCLLLDFSGPLSNPQFEVVMLSSLVVCAKRQISDNLLTCSCTRKKAKVVKAPAQVHQQKHIFPIITVPVRISNQPFDKSWPLLFLQIGTTCSIEIIHNACRVHLSRHPTTKPGNLRHKKYKVENQSTHHWYYQNLSHASQQSPATRHRSTQTNPQPWKVENPEPQGHVTTMSAQHQLRIFFRVTIFTRA